MMQDLDKLHTHVKKLDSLLKDRHEGLSTWCICVGANWKVISDMWTGESETYSQWETEKKRANIAAKLKALREKLG